MVVKPNHPLYIKTLSLINFKSYHQSTFDFSPHLNIIYGRNGVGKTNILDAIYTLSMTRSNFLITDSQLIHDNQDFFRLQGVLTKGDQDIKVVIKLKKGKKKIIERDGIAVPKLVDHVGFMPVVMITPDDLNLINASNIERRKLADATLSQVDHEYLENLVTYNRLLKQRNALLKTWQEKGTFDPILMDAYDQKMENPCLKIFEFRRQFFDQLLARLQVYYNILCEGKEPVTLKYASQLSEFSFSEISAKNRNRDRVLGRTHGGIHRDVISTFIDQRDARIYGSQGQKKSLVFAIKLAQLDYMRNKLQDQPIMLLDDVFDKLDRFRVEHLLSIILSDNFGQVFLTDTQWQRIESILDHYEVETKKFEIGS